MELLKGKNILITGATGSIGSRAARLLAASGAHVFLTGRDQQKLEVLAGEIGLPAGRFLAIDLRDSASISLLKDRFYESLPGIDILINAAGMGILKPLENLSENEFMQSIQVNLLAPFLLIKEFLPFMKEKKRGLIINIPGILGKVPMAGASAYCASKYGLVGMMQSVREEIKRTEIRITNIFLGGVDSTFWDNIELRVQRDKMILAEEAARSVWFLCQQPSSGVVSEMVIQPFNHQAI